MSGRRPPLYCTLLTLIAMQGHQTDIKNKTPFILDVKFVGSTSRGHTGFLIHLPSAVRAFIFFARRIQQFLSLVDRKVELRKNPSYRDSNSRPNVSEGYEVTNSPIPGLIWFASVYLVTTAGFVAEQLM